MSPAMHGTSPARSAAAPLTLAGAVALILVGAGGLSAPAAAVSPLVAMGTWPPVALPGLGSPAHHDPAEMTGTVRLPAGTERIPADRASRSGGRTDLAARQDARDDRAKPAKRTRRHPPARTRAQLVELKWAKQRTPSAAGYWLPTHNYELTARFGAGGGLWSGLHAGQDFAAPAGTPVRAVAGGRVIEAGWDDAYGWRITVRHRDGTETWYCHLSEMLITGGPVTAGQRIGRVGSTGNSTGPHLHFEVHPDGDSAVDPLPWLAAHGLDAIRLAFRADRDPG
jgi:murein DD-endopeptidase MepM/ murein hydrolase activator NlpD